jgi:glyoxylase-like metal-dependent hydrolase (beta-lactamase superfamily II)
MTKFTRRTMLAGTAAAAAAAANPRSIVAPARAAAPTAGKQAPGFYRYRVGNYEITVVTDGARSFPLPDTFVTNVKKDDVNAALEAAHLPRDTMTLVFNPIVVNTGSKLVAIDTGYGAAEAKPNTTHGQYQQNLAAAGIDAKAIDTVIISHYHPGHVNGLLGTDDKPAFPNAEILVPAAEHKFWMDDGEMSRASPGRMQGLFKDNRFGDARPCGRRHQKHRRSTRQEGQLRAGRKCFEPDRDDRFSAVGRQGRAGAVRQSHRAGKAQIGRTCRAGAGDW